MSDASRALAINPDCSRALICKGEALYNLGEFEAGLIQFERGWRARPAAR